ncbi:MAG: DEAD/DEAH box helicase [Gaiellales bacterium]
MSAPVSGALARESIETPFPIQRLVIPEAVTGRDILAKSPTGSGKTLAFAVPIVERLEPSSPRPAALILTPTRELAMQVGEHFRPIAKARGLRVATVYGGVPIGPQAKKAASAHIVVGTPGRLRDLVSRGVLSLKRIQIVVLDEADRMLDMGFRPQVDWLIAKLPGERQTMFFSATLDGAVGAMADEYTRDARRCESVPEKPEEAVPIDHRFVPVTAETKVETLVELLGEERGLALVFVRTKRGADRLARRLERHDVRAVSLHGDKTQAARTRALERFESGRISTLVATDLAARGLDLSRITHVINFDPPAEGKDYVHRVGRTGRAGRSGVGITLVLPEQQADVSRVALRLGHDEEFRREGMKVAPARLVYSGRRGRNNRWGPVRSRRKI